MKEKTKITIVSINAEKAKQNSTSIHDKKNSYQTGYRENVCVCGCGCVCVYAAQSQ